MAAVVAAFLSRRIGWGTGLLAGIAVAISTDFIDRSRLGSIDHHFLEFPLVLGIVAAVALVHRATNAREALRYGTILGIAMTAALLVQTALLLAGAIVLATVLLATPGGRFARSSAAVGFFLSAPPSSSSTGEGSRPATRTTTGTSGSRTPPRSPPPGPPASHSSGCSTGAPGT